MLAFAAREFALMEQLDDGSTQREHCESYFRQAGEHHPDWLPVVCPPEAAYLWSYWVSMNSRRTGNGFGPNPISDAAIVAWQIRQGFVLEPFEQHVIDAIESMFFLSQPKQKK